MRVPYKLLVIWQVCCYQLSFIIIQTSKINLSSFKISFLGGPPPPWIWSWWWGWWCWCFLKPPGPPSCWFLLHVLVVVATTKVGHSPGQLQRWEGEGCSRSLYSQIFVAACDKYDQKSGPKIDFQNVVPWISKILVPRQDFTEEKYLVGSKALILYQPVSRGWLI